MLSSAMDRLSHRLSHSFRVAETLKQTNDGSNHGELVLGKVRSGSPPDARSGSFGGRSSSYGWRGDGYGGGGYGGGCGGGGGGGGGGFDDARYSSPGSDLGGDGRHQSRGGGKLRNGALLAPVRILGESDPLDGSGSGVGGGGSISAVPVPNRAVLDAFPKIAARLCKLSRVKAKLIEREKPKPRTPRAPIASACDAVRSQVTLQREEVRDRLDDIVAGAMGARLLFREALGDGAPLVPDGIKSPSSSSPSPLSSVVDGVGTELKLPALGSSGSQRAPSSEREEEGGSAPVPDAADAVPTLPAVTAQPKLTRKYIETEFRKSDADGSQLLDALEFKAFLNSLHPGMKPARWAECKRCFTAYDTDNSGFLDLSEFVALHEELFGPVAEDDDDDEDDDGASVANGVDEEETFRHDPKHLALLLGGEPGTMTHAILTNDVRAVDRHLEDISSQLDRGGSAAVGASSAHVGMGGIPLVVIALYVRNFDVLKRLVQCHALDEGLEASERQWLACKCDLGDHRALKVGINELYNNAWQRLETLIALGAASGAGSRSKGSSGTRGGSGGRTVDDDLDTLREQLQRKAQRRSKEAQRARAQKAFEREDANTSSTHRRRSLARLGLLKDSGASTSRWDVHEQDRELFIAVMQHDVVAVADALRLGANVAAEDNEKNQPLYFAICYGFSDVAELLLEHGGASVHHINLYKCSLLHAAALHGQIPAIHLLMRHGGWALLGKRNTLGQRPVDAARSYYIKEYLYGYMLDRAAKKDSPRNPRSHSVNDGDDDGDDLHRAPRASFHRKRFASNRDQGRYLGFVINQYVDAVKRDDFEFLRDEEQGGADLDLPCAFGMTPLMHAVVYARERIVAHLVEQADADVCAASLLGNTPLHFAYGVRDAAARKRMVGYLRAHGADTCAQAQNVDGFVPRQCTAEALSKHFVNKKCKV